MLRSFDIEHFANNRTRGHSFEETGQAGPLGKFDRETLGSRQHSEQIGVGRRVAMLVRLQEQEAIVAQQATIDDRSVRD
ncbi:hypothetical protein [Burkholderia sp. LMG 21824]|uniref:hypothetical protein n=1 Tax=Burkholderia sp. LMG 21824 TaxID=3158172 RepID=UPI003C305EE5